MPQWIQTSSLPNVITGGVLGSLDFTDIVSGQIYVLDRGSQSSTSGIRFYSYNLVTDVWTELAAPNTYIMGVENSYTLVRAGTTRICAGTDMLAYIGVGGGTFPRRIAIYNIAANTWSYSSQLFTSARQMHTFVAQDSDTLWLWTRVHDANNASNRVHRCQRYVISTDTLTEFVTVPSAQGYNFFDSGIDGDYVYGGTNSTGTVVQYRISTDTYTNVSNPSTGYVYMRGKGPANTVLFRTSTTPHTLGYLDISLAPTLSNNTSLFAAAGLPIATVNIAAYNEDLSVAMIWNSLLSVPYVYSLMVVPSDGGGDSGEARTYFTISNGTTTYALQIDRASIQVQKNPLQIQIPGGNDATVFDFGQRRPVLMLSGTVNETGATWLSVVSPSKVQLEDTITDWWNNTITITFPNGDAYIGKYVGMNFSLNAKEEDRWKFNAQFVSVGRSA